MISLINILVVTFFSTQVFAYSGGNEMSGGTPQTLEEKVKQRWYLGGKDEEPLVVQKVLPQPVSKVSLFYLRQKTLEEVRKKSTVKKTGWGKSRKDKR